MQWSVVQCSCCHGPVLVPPDAAARVLGGESHVLCEGCMQTVDPALGVGPEDNERS